MPLHTRWSEFRTSFQFKLISIFTLLTLLITCLLAVLYAISEIDEARNFASIHLQLRAQQLADSIRLPLYAENRNMLRMLAEQAAKSPEIRAVVITAQDGRVLADVRIPDPTDKSKVISQTAEAHSNPLVDDIEASMTGGTHNPARLLGLVRLDQGTVELSRSNNKVVTLSIGMALLFWLIVSFSCFLVLRKVTRSFNALMNGIATMREGDFTSRIDISSTDEPGRAAQAINNLADALLLRAEENKLLQEERLDFERQMLHAQKLESLGVMAGGIAHDYNNLLQSILGNIELAMLKIAPNTHPQKYLTNAMNSGKLAAHLTGLMLTYVGKGFTTRSEQDLNDLVWDNAEMLRTAASTAVSTEMRLSPERLPILADKAQVRQVIMNLITNAAESIEELPGFVRLTTGIRDCSQACLAGSLLDEKPNPGRFAFLEVTDNGCGMNEETCKRLFDPFFTTKFTGRGLGMSAVMGILRSHDGALFMESTPRKGTTFVALFPISESALSAPEYEHDAPPPETDAAPETQFSGTALVVDDEKPVLKICTKMVELCGFKVITACDGIEAVTKFRRHADDINVVLLDLTMPNMDGIAAMTQIRAIRPDCRVIISSGFNEDELSERINGHTPSGFMRKPYNMKDLRAELRRVLQSD